MRVAARGDGLTLTAVEVSAHVDVDDLRAGVVSAEERLETLEGDDRVLIDATE